MLARQLQTFGTVPRLQDAMAARFEQVTKELHVQIVIFDDEDRFGGRSVRSLGHCVPQTVVRCLRGDDRRYAVTL